MKSGLLSRSSGPLLPWEVIERIIGLSCDPETLHNFSLTCRDLRPRSLCLLVSDASLHSRDQVFDFCEFLKAKPHLKPLVRSILVDPGNFAPVPLFHMLPNLSEIHFVGIDCMDGDYGSRHPSFSRMVLNESTLKSCRFPTTHIETLSLSDVSFATSLQFLRVLSAFTSIVHLVCSNAFIHVKGDLGPLDVAKRRLAPRLRLLTLTIVDGRDGLEDDRNDIFDPEGVSAGALLLDLGLVQSTVESLTVEGVYRLTGLPRQFNWSRLRCLSLELRYQEIEGGIALLKDFHHLTNEVTVKIREEIAIPIVENSLIQPADLSELERTLLGFPQAQLVWVRAIFPIGIKSFWVQDVEKLFPTLSKQGALTVVSDEALRTPQAGGHFTHPVDALVISPDSKWAASTTLYGITLWRVADGAMVQQWIVHDGYTFKWLAFSPNSRYLAYTSPRGNGSVIWDLEGGPPREFTVKSEVEHCAWSPRGDVIASGSRNGDLRLWDANTLQPVDVVERAVSNRIELLSFSPNGRWVLIGYRSGISGTWNSYYYIWDVESGKGRQLRMSVHAMANAEKPSGIHLPVTAAFNLSSTRLVVVSITGVVEIMGTYGGIWGRVQVALGCEVRRLSWRSGWHLAFSPDGNTVLTLPEHGEGPPTYAMKLWDAHTGVELLTLEGHEEEVSRACFSPCGKYVASASWDGTVGLWQTRDGSCIVILYEHDWGVSQVVFSPDGKTLITGDADGNTVIHRMSDVLAVEEWDE